MVISALTPLLIFGAISLYTFQSSLRTSIQNSFHEISLRASEEISLFLNHSKEILETLATDLQETNLNPEQTQRILENYVIRFPQFNELIIYSKKDQVFQYSTPGLSRKDLPDQGLIDRALQGNFVPSKTYLSPDLTPMIWFLVPMEYDQDNSKILMGQVDLLQMWKWVSDIRLGKQGYATVVDKDGMVVASGDPYYKRNILSTEDPVPFEGFASNGKVDVVELQKVHSQTQILHTPRGRDLISMKRISETPHWFLVFSQPYQEAFAAIRSISVFLIILTVLFLVLMFITATLVNRNLILKPVNQLVTATKAIGRGELDYQIPELGKDELGQLGTSFNRMGRDLAKYQQTIIRQEKMTMFGRMASSLAHDLKHPVKNIESVAKLLKEHYAEAEFRETFNNVVKREFTRINQFLEDLRNLTHEMPFRPQSADLVVLITEVLESFQGTMEQKQITTRFLKPDDFPKIRMDPDLMRRALENLISNAQQAMNQPKGQIIVSLAQSDQRVNLAIEDTGPGIPPKILEGLFEEFKTTKNRGLGLGLAITKKIMELHEGTVSVASEVRQGSVFTLSWPLKVG